MSAQMEQAETQESAADYDAVPYDSHPYWQSSPDWLGAIAMLFGLRCAPPATARVLEVGCASGGNLIPHAARNPEGEYIGVDYSRVQIQDGQKRVDALGLKNIKLLHASVAALPEDLGTFDYIIVHGVYSWVAPEIQDAILRACKTHLRPDGVAYVSYNVYPGWKTREIMRDAMIFHTRQIADPSERLGHAKGMAEYMQKIARPNSMFKYVMEAEGDAVAKGSPSYLLHEYLEQHNSPCYFREFAARALSHDLGYLGDSALASMFPANLGDDAAQRLNNVARNQIDLEQYIDFLSNRAFRQTLLVHADAQSRMRRDLGRPQMEKLAFYSGLRQMRKADGELVEPPTWTSPWGGTIQPSSVVQRTLIDALGAAYPGRVSAEALEKMACEAAIKENKKPEDAVNEIYVVLRALVSRGMVRISTQALEVAQTASEKPVADWLARQDAATGRALTTGIAHDLTQLNIVELVMLPLLDGTHDQDALVEHLISAEREDRLRFHDAQQQRLTEPEAVRTCAREHVAMALQTLGAKGLIVA